MANTKKKGAPSADKLSFTSRDDRGCIIWWDVDYDAKGGWSDKYNKGRDYAAELIELVAHWSTLKRERDMASRVFALVMSSMLEDGPIVHDPICDGFLEGISEYLYKRVVSKNPRPKTEVVQETKSKTKAPVLTLHVDNTKSTNKQIRNDYTIEVLQKLLRMAIDGEIIGLCGVYYSTETPFHGYYQTDYSRDFTNRTLGDLECLRRSMIDNLATTWKPEFRDSQKYRWYDHDSE